MAVVALAAIAIIAGCSKVRVGEELSLICPAGEISCESDQRVILYATPETIIGAWNLREQYTPSSCRTWMKEAVRSRILPVGTRIKVESIEKKEGKDILRIRTLDGNKAWYVEPQFVRK